MHIHRALAAQFVAELADRFEERQAFDIAHRAADLDQDELLVGGVGDNEFLDGVGDVRDDLHGRPEIFAAPLAGDHRRIDAAGGDVVALPGVDPGEPLVMAEIEIGLSPVVGHEDFAVLIGTHRSRIDVEIGIELAQPDPVTTSLQQRAQRRRRKTLTKRGNHAARYEYKARHGLTAY